MRIGIGMSFKTLAARPEPLQELYASLADEAAMAEDLGFDFLGVNEHHFSDDAWCPSPLVVMSNLAARTSAIRLMTNVFLLPLYHPLRVSEDLATLDILSGGRVDFVVGTGSVKEEFTAMGIDPARRWGRLFEALDLIRLSYEQDTFSFEGKHFTVAEPTRQTTKPVQAPLPMWVGGFGPQLHYRSGRRGLHSQGLPQMHPEYLRGLAEAGIDPMTRNHSTTAVGHISDSREKAWEECREAWWSRQNEYRKRTFIAHGPDVPQLSSLEAYAEPPADAGLMPPIIGSPDEVLETLRPVYEHCDATHFVFTFRAAGAGMPVETARNAIRLFAEEVMPVIRCWGREPADVSG